MKITLLSNMYPSNKDSLFGVFVKNFKEKLELKDVKFVRIAVIKGKTPHALFKLLRYVKYYFKAMFVSVFFKSDLVYVHFLTHNSPLIIMLGRLFRKKIVVNIHGSDIMNYNHKPIIKWLNTIAISSCQKIVVPSLYFSEIVNESFSNKIAEKIVIYPSGGINTAIFNSLEENESLERKNIIHLGMTSRIDANKGWDIFLKSVASLKQKGYEVSGFIIGQGRKEDEMMSLINELSLSNDIKFLGLLKQLDIAKHYCTLDVFIFPTLLNESLGLVGLEAMACGLPVIASRIGAPSAYIEDGVNGLLFEPNNVEDLVQKIEMFTDLSMDKKNDMRDAAIRTSKAYDSDLIAEVLVNELKKI